MAPNAGAWRREQQGHGVASGRGMASRGRGGDRLRELSGRLQLASTSATEVSVWACNAVKPCGMAITPPEGRLLNTPKTVDPDPVICTSGDPAARSTAMARDNSGCRAITTSCRSFPANVAISRHEKE